MCPVGGKLFPNIFPQEICCHVLLIESDNRLILVDTGLGLADFQDPSRLGIMHYFLGIQGRIEEAAINQIKKLGFSPSDVTDLIPTHLDLDHAGGIPDFTGARVHTLQKEYDAAQKRGTFLHKHRYRKVHWNQDTKWKIHDENYGENWFGFQAVRQLEDLPPEILLIPLFGHTQGHFGVAVKTEKGWLLHAGDAFYNENEILIDNKSIFGLKMFQRIVHEDHTRAIENQKKLKDLREQNAQISVFCSHDPKQYKKLSTN
tara:strand:- start:7500 stop:8276 length:777 start_codon:yes stop_codon:yes gene_type:complete